MPQKLKNLFFIISLSFMVFVMLLVYVKQISVCVWVLLVMYTIKILVNDFSWTYDAIDESDFLHEFKSKIQLPFP